MGSIQSGRAEQVISASYEVLHALCRTENINRIVARPLRQWTLGNRSMLDTVFRLESSGWNPERASRMMSSGSATACPCCTCCINAGSSTGLLSPSGTIPYGCGFYLSRVLLSATPRWGRYQPVMSQPPCRQDHPFPIPWCLIRGHGNNNFRWIQTLSLFTRRPPRSTVRASRLNRAIRWGHPSFFDQRRKLWGRSSRASLRQE